MAIAFESYDTASGSGTSITITKPSGVTDGDVLVASIALSFNAVDDITPPDGNWHLVRAEAHSSQFVQLHLFYKVVTDASGEGADYTFSWTGSYTNNGGIARYSGVNTSTPSDVASSSNDGTSTSPTGSSITTATNGSMLVWVCGAVTATGARYTPPGGFAEEWEIAAVPRSTLADYTQATAGASGDQVGTLSNSKPWLCFLWALRPILTPPPADSLVMATILRRNQHVVIR